ncbi:MAG: hypothetical protein AAB562_01760 [Patescibacteria group bacterium]
MTHVLHETEAAAQVAGFEIRFGSVVLENDDFTAEEIGWFVRGEECQRPAAVSMPQLKREPLCRFPAPSSANWAGMLYWGLGENPTETLDLS